MEMIDKHLLLSDIKCQIGICEKRFRFRYENIIENQPPQFDIKIVIQLLIEKYDQFFENGDYESALWLLKKNPILQNVGGETMNRDEIIHQLEKLQVDHPEQKIIVETPDGTISLRIGDAMIYEGMNREIVIDSE